MSNVKLTCSSCKEDFFYAKKEHNRQTKKGRTKFFCSRSCSTKWHNQNRSSETQKKMSEAISKRSRGNTYAKKGEFTYYLSRQIPKRREASDIDESHLHSIWTGKCALSGIPIHKKKGKSRLDTASLDRIDSNIGYSKGNVQFVAYGLNLAKSTFADEEVRRFINLIRQ
jgi:hypothetical protein